MKLSDVNIVKLVLNVYSSNYAYECDYTALPRPFHSIALMLKGKGELYYGEQTIPLSRGDVFLIPQNCTYASRWFPDDNNETAMFSMHFAFERQISNFAENFYPVQKYRAKNFDALENNYKKFQAMLLDAPDAAIIASIFFGLLSDMLPNFTGKKVVANEKIRPALDYISENCTKELNVKELAELCYLSESRFFSLFKKVTGLAPIAYKNSVRLGRAADYLAVFPDKSIEDVSDLFDYSSPSYFIREFRKAFGVTPSAYRKSADSGRL